MLLPLSLLLSLSLSLSVPSVLGASSSSHPSSSSVPATSAGGASSSSPIGTPSNSASLPQLSNAPTCVVTCLEMAAAADGCVSEVAVDCFCPSPRTYTSAILSCMQACPDEITTAESIVESFCAAASTSTSLSFASFIPSLSSSSVSASLTSSHSSMASTTTSPSASTSPSPSATSAARRIRGDSATVSWALGTGTVLLGVLLGAAALL
uniref:CFEM domain-containing protein n=1 Tax=Mycena chlorophos TaxID=658473 RepID=A0ABQ0L199_MYCCL|nr:predicted protein [Mycena chlorophos]